jgi:hypothetical protein
MLAAIEAGPGSLGTYPPLIGRRPYRVNTYDAYDAVGGIVAARWVESDHLGWSYGQNLAINWTFVGGTNVVRLSDTSRMFAGLRFWFDEAGLDPIDKYLVVGVYPALGYVTVMRNRPGTGASYLAGTAGTTYSGATIKQEPYRFSRAALMGTYTVATLTSAATAGARARAYVSDANSTTFGSIVAGGGANFVPVYSDGSNWRIG